MELRERLEFALDATDTGMWTFRHASGSLSVDERAAKLLDIPAGVDIQLSDVLSRVSPHDVDRLERLIVDPLPGEDVEIRIHRAGKDERWVCVRARSGAAGDVLGTMRDVTASRQHDQQVHLLMREVTHRSKNLLAIIQAMARQTVKDSLTAADFEHRFSSRLRGLSFSHELLAEQDWRGAALPDLAKGHLQSVLELHGERVVIAGPAIFISPEAAQNIGLALNELASNAVKYGALADTVGRISLEWSIDSDEIGPRWLHLVWNEYGGRAVQPPSRQGFGHKVMERVVARALDGTATMTFAPTGLQWSLRVPTSHVVRQG